MMWKKHQEPHRHDGGLKTESCASGSPQYFDLKERIHTRVIELMDMSVVAALDPERLKGEVTALIEQVLAQESALLNTREREQLVQEVQHEVLGYGPLESLLQDPTISDVLVNTAKQIYIERAGKLELTSKQFRNDTHLRKIIDKIVSAVGRRIDESSPMVDARLPDGSRVNAIIPPLAIDGPVLSIRRFAADPYRMADLVEFGTLTSGLAEILRAAVQARLNILVSGGTGAGKTTMLNVLSNAIPNTERIVTIEDSAELQLQQEHVVRLETRPSNIEGNGAVAQRDLVRNALRMRPDRIVVGEVRGGEVLDMLQAMNTGHDGSLSTIHANSTRDALSRLETMVLMSGMTLPLRAMRDYVAAALGVVVHLARLSDGTRKVIRLTEVTGMEEEVITAQDLFTFDYRSGMDDQGRYRGTIQPTGLRPSFSERLGEQGVRLEPERF